MPPIPDEPSHPVPASVTLLAISPLASAFAILLQQFLTGLRLLLLKFLLGYGGFLLVRRLFGGGLLLRWLLLLLGHHGTCKIDGVLVFWLIKEAPKPILTPYTYPTLFSQIKPIQSQPILFIIFSFLAHPFS
ncbi:hypothetical protein U1Q18_031804 [Sarracenia purpurea var. burkii]